MSFFDIFKGNYYKKELEQKEKELSDLQATFTPEMREAENIKNLINQLTQNANNARKNLSDIQSQINEKSNTITTLKNELSEKKKQIIQTDETILLQEFGLYEPKYAFSTSEEYQGKLKNIRTEQKELIKNDGAVVGNTQWTVDNSLSKGRKMIKDTQKLLLRAFNSECDELIDKVKYNNYDVAKKRITTSYNAISKLATSMHIEITYKYYSLKIEELTLAFEYAQKKQEEKEEQRELRERMREEAKLQKEIESERKKVQKEKSHYQNALSQINEQIEKASSNELQELLQKKAEIDNQLLQIQKSLENMDYREANQRAGYVYIISNIGSFGNDVYKIGMTRRLEPMDRIDELGDASVPFKFDVHAMIFSDDAPALENALHKAFENKKVNMVNQRREFFKVSLDEIKSVVKKNFDKTVEFNDIADAEQYRVSQKIKNSN